MRRFTDLRYSSELQSARSPKVTLPSVKKLGRYEVRSKLTWMMGEMYLAEDAQLRRQVALKSLPGDLASDQLNAALHSRSAGFHSEKCIG